MTDPVTAAAAKGAATAAAKPAASLIGRLGMSAYNKLIVKYTACFDHHIKDAYDRCATVKNILYKDNSVPLKSQYVHVRFQQKGNEIPDRVIVDKLLAGGRFLISGTAGAGKTMFMKWSVVDIVESIKLHQLIPIFSEMRYISAKDASSSIEEYLLSRYSTKSKSVGVEKFRIGIEEGQFIIVMDAIDEIDPNFRVKVIDNIHKFLSDFPKCPVLISSRPNPDLEYLKEIDIVRTTPMNLEQIVDVLSRVEYNLEVKNRLVSQLEAGLFEEHKRFLSNPLLATIMLLTFDHAAEIPTKITSFYRDAFIALYQRHDAAKGAYRRGHYAGLQIDEYEKIFSAFCYQSCRDSKLEFSDIELLQYFRSSARYSEIDKRPEDLIRDALESVCLLQKEGLDNVFVHRSFQEYFATIFIKNYRGDSIFQIIEEVVDPRGNSILKMLSEVSPDIVKFEWITPRLKKYLRYVNRLDLTNKEGLAKFIKYSYGELGIDVKTGKVSTFTLHPEAASYWLSSVDELFPELTTIRDVFDSGIEIIDLSAAQNDPRFNAFETFRDAMIGERFDHDPQGDEELIVTHVDADWLCLTQLPLAMEGVRAKARSALENLEQLRARRKSAIGPRGLDA